MTTRDPGTGHDAYSYPYSGSAPRSFDSDAAAPDVYLYARHIYRVGNRWDVTVRGDCGFGDSEGTLNLLPKAGFRIPLLTALCRRLL